MKSKIVLITGGTGLLGRSICLGFLEDGFTVLINYFNNDKRALDLKKDMKDKGFDIYLYKANIKDNKSVNNMFIDIIRKFKTIDILINNAGDLGPYGNFIDFNISEIQDIFNLNLFSSMRVSKNFIKIINSQNKKGLIINTSSSYSDFKKGGDNKAIPYCVSKAGLDSFTVMLSKHLSPSIRVNSVSPGPILYSDEVNDNRFDGKILNNKWVTAEQVAKGFLFIANNEGINGEIINIDGGLFYGI